jgi:hypothetical protein
MHRFICTIIDRFGGRLGGTRAEAEAQAYVLDQIRRFDPSARAEPFSGALWAMFQVLRLSAFFYFSALLAWSYSPALAGLLSVAGTVLFVSRFLAYLHFFDFLFPTYRSSNVVATLEPEQEVRATLILSGHIDSTREFIWWYWLKTSGMVAMILHGVIQNILFPLFCILTALGLVPENLSVPIFYTFLALTPLAVVYVFIHGNRVVDGAQDNLSGVAVAFHTFSTLARSPGKSKFKHLRIRFVSFGCEEGGLCGSRAFAKQHKAELIAEKAHLLNMDGILDPENLFIIRSETATFTRYDADWVEQVKTGFEAEKISYRFGVVPFGGSDGVSLQREGIPATTLIGFDIHQLHPTYHTRLDTPEWVDPESLDRVHRVLTRIAEDWDKKLSQAG